MNELKLPMKSALLWNSKMTKTTARPIRPTIIDQRCSWAYRRNPQRLTTLAQTEQPALIILDLLMPEMNGFEVLDRLEQSPLTRQLPIIIFTVKQLTVAEKERLNGRIAWLAQKEAFNQRDFAGMVREALRRTLIERS